MSERSIRILWSEISEHYPCHKIKNRCYGIRKKKKANNMSDINKKAFAYCENVRTLSFDRITATIAINWSNWIGDEYWPLNQI